MSSAPRVAGPACRAAFNSRRTHLPRLAITNGIRTSGILTRSRLYCSESTPRQSLHPSSTWWRDHPESTSPRNNPENEQDSQHHYDNLRTSSSIASTYIDLSRIPTNEHEQILKDFILVPNYLSPPEQEMMIQAATKKLKRALGKQVRYEDGHFDGVITRYRECSASDWGTGAPSLDKDQQRTTPSEIMQSIKHEFFPHQWSWVAPHLLELEAGRGGIKPHVDHLEASGEVVAGLCLGSDAVMELIHEDEPERLFKVWLPKGAFYFQRGSVRYHYKHGIPVEPADHQFRGQVIPKEKRISVMLRNALDSRLRESSPRSSISHGMGM
ncbi:alkylated DNA repair protein alkB homolog 7 [Entomortierella parvispora]|uniref:Alkylated DNA repair protein alkB homolog 7 n=1 Tax=Entomortierella parvispora TaxID=205924 RepID=A0A9P3H768_9FUNG|nr:alkylated DNA repair protein alkB homolog 7 [Entomortierella parvispora]